MVIINGWKQKFNQTTFLNLVDGKNHWRIVRIYRSMVNGQWSMTNG